MGVEYAKGLHEVGDRVWAYTQPDGGWGWSNAGLVVDGDRSLLVDTLFDLRLTAEMLDAMRSATPAAEQVDVVVNTHANGDHTYGNQLLPGAEIIASAATAAEFDATPPAVMQGFLDAAPDLGLLGEFVVEIFGPFDFAGITLVPPTRTFSGEVDLHVGDRRVQLVEMGPAHTAGDVVVWLPDERVVFTGDLLFHQGHPIVWAGPLDGWIAACERIIALEPDVVVPGHGPITTTAAVADLATYFRWLQDEAGLRMAAGMDALAAAADLHRALPDTPYAGWGDPERIVINTLAAYRDAGHEPADDVVTLFTEMAALRTAQGR